MTPHCLPKKNVGLGAAMPAFAESFPSDKYMLENKTYENAAVYENLETHVGGVVAAAEYEDILYQIGAGQYLPAGLEELEKCPANSYCPGGIEVLYSESESQGATSCPSGYPVSAVGASLDTQCYTACTVDTANIAHATLVSGNDYYGDGTDTCYVNDCEDGYHVEGSVEIIEQTPLIDVDYKEDASDMTLWAFISNSGSADGPLSELLTESNTLVVGFDYGVVYGRASCQATVHDSALNSYVYDYGRLSAMSESQIRSEGTYYGQHRANYVADTKDFQRALYVLFGLNKGASYSTSSEQGYCYCQLTGFIPMSQLESYEGETPPVPTPVVSAPWVFNLITGNNYTYGGYSSTCGADCAFYCAQDMLTDENFRGAVLGALDVAGSTTCEGNEITINWTDATDEDIDANNAGMCTYGGDIRTPVAAMEKPGKTFVGWKFSK